MIQRKQTLFLLAAVILNALVQFLPVQILTTGSETLILCLMPGCLAGEVKSLIYLPMVLNGLAPTLTFITIFLYKNRKLQIKICNILMLLNVMIIGALFAFNYFIPEGTVDYKIACVFPAINSVLIYLAAVFIKKDEELVRSADRIR